MSEHQTTYTPDDIKDMGLIPEAVHGGIVLTVRVPGSLQVYPVKRIGVWPRDGNGERKVACCGDDAVLFWAPAPKLTQADLNAGLALARASMPYARDPRPGDPYHDEEFDPYHAAHGGAETTVEEQ